MIMTDSTKPEAYLRCEQYMDAERFVEAGLGGRVYFFWDFGTGEMLASVPDSGRTWFEDHLDVIESVLEWDEPMPEWAYDLISDALREIEEEL